jgi:hypothetical protein
VKAVLGREKDMMHFKKIAAGAVVLGLLLILGVGCAQQGSNPVGGIGGSSGKSESGQSQAKDVTPTVPPTGGAVLKLEMYAFTAGAAGGSDVQEENGTAYLVFEKQAGPPLIYTVHGRGNSTWKEDAKGKVCSWTAEAGIAVKVEGVLDPSKCQVQLVITEIFDDPVMTSQSGPCGNQEFTEKTVTRRVDLPLVNNQSATTGPSIYDLKVTIYDILLDDSTGCIVPE